MKQGCRFVATSLLLSIFCMSAMAQTDFGSFFLEGTWAGREINPADSLNNKIEIYLPGIYFESHHSNQIALNSVISKSGDQNVINVSALLNEFDDENTLENNFKVNTIGVGVKIKNFDIENGSDASLFTDNDVYQLTFNTDYTVLSSNTLDINGLSDFTFQNDLAKQFLSSNNGWAFDLAASFQVTDALRFSASIVDIGSIDWNNETSSFTSQGSYTYEGFELDDFLLNDDVEFEIKLDTLEEIFAFQESDTEVNTKLGAKLYLAGQYELTEKIQVGALLVMNDTDFEGSAYGLNLQYNLGTKSLIGLNYSYRKDSFSNLGIQFLTRIGPIVIFGNTDNVFSLVSNDNYRFNGRVGLGLSF